MKGFEPSTRESQVTFFSVRILYVCWSEGLIGRTWRRQQKAEHRLGSNWKHLKGMHHAARERPMKKILSSGLVRDDDICGFIGRLGGLIDF